MALARMAAASFWGGGPGVRGTPPQKIQRTAGSSSGKKSWKNFLAKVRAPRLCTKPA